MTTFSLFYLDTSLYLQILLKDPQAQVYQTLLQNQKICSSIIFLIEAERSLVRLSRENKITLIEYQEALAQLKKDAEVFIFKEVTRDLCLNNDYPPIKTPRSIDLLHLRTAKWFMINKGLKGFVTLDIQQKLAAKDFGLPVVE